MTNTNLEILYEDTQIIVVYKEAGFPVQTAQIGKKDIESELKNYLKQPFIGVIHRLDQPVEGILIFGKTKESTAELNKQLVKEDFCKEYLAVICGKVGEKEGMLVDYLVKDKNIAKVVSEADMVKSPEFSKLAKKAVLTYEVLRSTDKVSLLRVILQTGRFHQIRAQLSHFGHGILGDSKYGSDKEKQLAAELKIKDVALCAHQLTFHHPSTKKQMTFTISPKNPAFSVIPV